MSLFLKAGSVTILIFQIFLLPSSAKEAKYKVSDIPVALVSNANAVIRNSETVREISDINKLVTRVTYAITILNEKGIDNSVLTEYYNKFITVRKIKADLYDRDGIPIKNSENIKVEDYSANDGSSLYIDNRVKVLDPKYRILPFTVEYTYEISFDGLFFYPDWKVYDDYNISVEKSSLTVTTPKDFKFRYKEKNIHGQCKISDGKDKTEYAWKFENMPALKKEPFSTPYEEYTPVVYSAPSDFEIDGYNGNLDSWDNFGKWINKLGKGRNILDAESAEKVKRMVSGLKTDNEKIRVLYNYFQNKVRYVSLQIGIGGWQTIPAEKVDQFSYGDCKALSNYMKSLLDIIGIKSYYTLVRSGEFAPFINTDFPSSQFDHVILCIPEDNDTIWLECTSQTIPFGYLGTFTDDRKALLTGDSGGTLVTTMKYSMDDNKKIRKAVVDLTPDGNGTSTVETEYQGIFYDKVNPVLHLDEVDRRKFVQSKISIPSYRLISYSHKEDKSIIPGIREDLNLKLINYGTVMGNKLILKPNLMTRVAELPVRSSDRKSEICIRRPLEEIDTVIFRIPAGYKIAQIPARLLITTKFGEFSSEILSDGKSITYIRSFKLYNNIFPVSDYPAFVDFFDKISSSDESKIALFTDR
jgi:hypothetical protein